jgi:hypothetical protein
LNGMFNVAMQIPSAFCDIDSTNIKAFKTKCTIFYNMNINPRPFRKALLAQKHLRTIGL